MRLPVSGDDWAAWLLAEGRPQSPPRTTAWRVDRPHLARPAAGLHGQADTSGPVNSQTVWDRRQIRVRGDLPERDATRALLHELAHILADGDRFHPPGASTARCRGLHKLTADSVAFLAATRLGIDAPAPVWPLGQ